jgi:hypothetical protein
VQSEAFEHEIALTVHDPVGIMIEVHVVPPSVVTMPKAAI